MLNVPRPAIRSLGGRRVQPVEGLISATPTQSSREYSSAAAQTASGATQDQVRPTVDRVVRILFAHTGPPVALRSHSSRPKNPAAGSPEFADDVTDHAQ